MLPQQLALADPGCSTVPGMRSGESGSENPSYVEHRAPRKSIRGSETNVAAVVFAEAAAKRSHHASSCR